MMSMMVRKFLVVQDRVEVGIAQIRAVVAQREVVARIAAHDGNVASSEVAAEHERLILQPLVDRKPDVVLEQHRSPEHLVRSEAVLQGQFGEGSRFHVRARTGGAELCARCSRPCRERCRLGSSLTETEHAVESLIAEKSSWSTNWVDLMVPVASSIPSLRGCPDQPELGRWITLT